MLLNFLKQVTHQRYTWKAYNERTKSEEQRINMETPAMTTIIQIKLETHQAIATSHGEGAAMGCNYQVTA